MSAGELDLFGAVVPSEGAAGAKGKARPLQGAARVLAGSASPSYCDGDTFAVAEVRAVVLRDDSAPLTLRKLDRPCVVAQFWREVVERAPWFDPEKECVVLFLLDRKNQVRGFNLVSQGTQTASLLHPREILRMALVGNACGFVVAHNHPSGDPAPSAPDMNVTRMINEAAKAIDVTFADHVIVGKAGVDPMGRGYFSFRDAGFL